MIVSIKNKLIFIGVPHTGSTSIHECVKHAIMTGEEMETLGFNTLATDEWIYDHGDYKHSGIGKIEAFMRKKDYDLTGSWTAYYSFRDPIGFHSSDYYLKHRLAHLSDWCKDYTPSHNNRVQETISRYPTIDSYLLNFVTPHQWTNHYKIMESEYLTRDNSGEMNIKFERRDYDRETYSKTFDEVVEAMGIEPSKRVHINDSQKKREPLKQETLDVIKKMIKGNI